MKLFNYPEFTASRQSGLFDRFEAIASQIGAALRLTDKLPINAGQVSGDSTARQTEDVVGEVEKRLSVSLETGTYIADLSFRASSPVMAAQAANEFAEEYIVTEIQNRRSFAEKEAAVLNERLSILGTEVNAARSQGH